MTSLYHLGRGSEAKDHKKKVKCDGWTDRWTDGRTNELMDRRTDGLTDGPTKRGVDSRSTRLKREEKK